MRKLLWIGLAAGILVIAAVVLGAPVPILAQSGSPASPAGAPTPTMNEINAIARDLWCPLCNGVRLDNCELQACVQMREVISQKMMAGESKESIKAYFVQQYGDVVLGQPPREGFNLIVWIFPILAAVVGLGWVGYLVVTWKNRRTAAAGADAARPNGARPAAGSPGDDEYAQRVERELNQLD